VSEGRALIMAVNKWDLVASDYKPKIVKFLDRQLEKNLGEVVGCPIQLLSAIKSVNISALMDQVLNAYDKWNTRVNITFI
jgi:predicted GTPase